MGNLKKLTAVLIAILAFNITASSKALAKDISDEEYGDLIKAILVKNQVIEQESQVSNILLKYTMASAADDLANLSGGNTYTQDRKVQFKVDLLQTDGQYRIYTCNLTVKVQSNNDFAGSKLSSCEFRQIAFTTYNY
jgi:hypothetical protein